MNLQNPPIALITTGGTIDKIHDKFTESLTLEDTPSAAEDIVNSSFIRIDTIINLFRIDSHDMNDAQREELASTISSLTATAVVVTHGTSTIEITAKKIAARKINKTIVLVGAMRPYAYSQTEAACNLGGAIIAARLLPIGVYVVMNGCVIPASVVRKNTQTGRFDEQFLS